MSVPLRVLILEDRPEDAELVSHELRRAGFEPDWQRVDTKEGYLGSLDPALDLILADYAMPQFDALRALRLLQTRGLEIPFIIVSGTIGEEAAVSAMQEGATDYLLKDRLARLGSAVKRALEQKRLRDEKRQADAALLASEKRFRALIEHSSDAVSVLDASGTIRYASPATTQILGYEADELVGRSALELIYPDDLSEDADRFSQFLQHPALSVSSQVRVRHEDGSWRWVEAASTNLLAEPAVQGIIVNYRDITERKLAEQQLRLQSAALEAAANAIVITDRDGMIQWANRAFTALTGYTLDEARGRNPRDLVRSGKHDTAFYKNMWDTILAGNTWRGELINKRKDGRLYSEEMALTPVHSGETITYFIAIKQDITDRKRAEEALRESEERYHSLFDGVPVGLYRTTPDGRILDANPALVRMLGYSDRQTLLATNTADIYANFEERTRAHNLAERDGSARRVEVQLRRFDGTTLWVIDNARAVQDRQGRVLYYEGSMDDITQRKRAEEEIRRRASQQSALNAIITAATQADTSLKELLQIAVDHTLQALGLDMGAIWLEEGGYVTHGLPAEIAADMGPVVSAAGASVHSAIAVDDWQEVSGDSSHASLAPLMTRFGIRASLSVPLVLEKRPVGGLSIASAQPRHWSEEDVALLEAIGHELGAAAHRTRLLEETRRRLAELETIVAVAAALRAAPTHGDMLPVVLNQLRSLLKADGAALVMRSAANDEMVVALARGTWADWTGLHIALDEDPIGHIFSRASARPYLNNAIDGDPHLARSALMNGMRAVACVPLIAEKQTIGVLAIGRETEIADNELHLLSAIGDMSANALHRAHIVETLEQRVAERTAELERQRQRMQAILDTAGDGIVITDLDRTIEYVNPAQEQLTGFSAAEVMGQTTDIWHSGQAPRTVYDDMQNTLRRGETWRGEVTHRRKDGTPYDVALTITPLRDAHSQMINFVGIHRDISRRKELDRLKSKFVSDVSHELRAPVTNLKLYVDMLEHGRPEKRAQYMSTLNEQADRLVTLVEEILDLSRLELGADKVKFAEVNLNVLARQVVDAHQPMAEAAGLALTFTPDPELAPVWGEHNQLAQVITNLVTNAIRYTPAGQVQVSTRLREGQACLEVRDTGMGIHAEDIPHLFERFYRGRQRAGQPIISGTGLGLAIVKEIVDLHSGGITVSSQVGVGTTLTVCLPRHPSTED